ncbi:MAG: hypothetical protein Kow0069_15260 [Promethearchaeota archaeon]
MNPPHDVDDVREPCDYDDGEIVEPIFVTDDKGRVYCRRHTYVETLEENGYEVCLEGQCLVPGTENLLTCTTCGHYFNDDCYFQRDTIDEVENERRRGRVVCDLCGEKIHRSPVVFQKLYYKDRYGVEMPLVCCGCYASLKDNQYVERTRTRMLLMVISIAICVGFLVNYLYAMLFLTQWGIVVLIAPIAFWSWAAWKDIKRVYYAWRGRKFYAQIAQAFEEEGTGPGKAITRNE